MPSSQFYFSILSKISTSISNTQLKKIFSVQCSAHFSISILILFYHPFNELKRCIILYVIITIAVWHSCYSQCYSQWYALRQRYWDSAIRDITRYHVRAILFYILINVFVGL